jgi:Ca2+-binding RTX toxin-like protein
LSRSLERRTSGRQLLVCPVDLRGRPICGVRVARLERRDLQTGTTTLVSRASGEAGVDGNNASISPAISGDGRFVLFNSLASNLHPSDRDELEDVYLRDMQTGETKRVNRGITRIRGGIGVTGSPSISLDGRAVAFTVDDRIFVRDLETATAQLVGVGGSPSLSGDGRYVAFSSYASTLQPYHTAPFPDVFVRDMKRRRTILASRAANRFGTPGNGGSHNPSISADGRLVAFEARASNLHPHDRDRSGDVFVSDLGPDADRLAGGSGPDRICGRGGSDRLDGGPGTDRIAGGPGRDILRSRDNSPDGVDCGPGHDRVVADALDRLRRCERRAGM